MRQVMAQAVVGDDVLGDDPTVIELQDYVANLFEREAALFVPSGTMGNQLCLVAHAQPGWELLCERECHVINYEAGGPAVHANLLVNLLTTPYGMITADTVRQNVRQINVHCPRTKIVALENTHNRHGGTVLPQDEIVKVGEVCEEFGLAFHLDGARIWNAHVATGLSLAELTRPFDSVSVCLSKALGAPIGSLILGSSKFVERCYRLRKRFGGGMRQVGIIAAGGLLAVKNNIPKLADDHANARFLAEKLNGWGPFTVEMERVQTNIVIYNLIGEQDSQQVMDKLTTAGVWTVPFGPMSLRMVTHLDVSRADCEEAVERIKGLDW
jgi:threonine aldolase